MSSLPITVITCTRNPKPNYFQKVLDALKDQTLPGEKWEYLIVDNNSSKPVAEAFDFSWAPNARVVREETLGLTPARLRGIREAIGELLVFVDDDNVLDRDYLIEALRIAEARPWLGAWSGQSRGGFEVPAPEWTRHYWGNLVIREFDSDVWSNLPRLAETMPCGAGMCVRRAAARKYLEVNELGHRWLQLDRTGDSLLSGGDNDLAACACDIGLGVGLIATLKLTHLISRDRLTPEYHIRLAEGIAYSSVILDADRGIITPLRSVIGRLIDALRVIRLSPPHNKIVAAAFRGR